MSSGPVARAGRAATGVAAFLWDFVVGDDWLAAAGIAVLLALSALIVHAAHVNTWWLLPAGVTAVFAASVRRAVRAAAHPR